MANIASSKKDARRSAIRAVRNRSLRSAVKTKITRLRRALAERGEAVEDAAQLAGTAVSALDRATAKGVLHPNNAARRKSRLMKRLNAAGSESAEASAAPTAGARSARGSKSTSSAKSGSSKSSSSGKSGSGKSGSGKASSRRKSG
jgi:small subunit ribosomal protein S20